MGQSSKAGYLKKKSTLKMNLSERKAQETFRPWWDVFCRYCTIAALALCKSFL